MNSQKSSFTKWDRQFLAVPFLHLPSYIGIGPCPIQLVVVMAVRKAVRAATITFTATSTIRFVFISYILHLPSYIIHQFCPKSPPPVLLLPPWFWLPPFSVDPFSPSPVDPFSLSSISASSSLVTRFTSLPLRS